MKLDKDRILELMEAADHEWYRIHSDHPSQQYNYREHLDFVADYVAKKYNNKNNNHKRLKQVKVRSKDGPDKVHRLL